MGYDLPVVRKLRYEINLSSPVQADGADGITLRSISGDDLEGLAQLMLDSYVGTIDYEGETLDDARDEVRRFIDSGSVLLDCSLVAEDKGKIVSGVLVSLLEEGPFIGYVMTIPSHKNQGLARLVTMAAMKRLAAEGHELATLYITDGNVASEALFDSLGAVQVDE